MKKGLAVLLVLLMSMGTLATAFDAVVPSDPLGESAQVTLGEPSDDANPITPVIPTEPEHDPVLDFLKTLGDGPRPPLRDLPGNGEDNEQIIITTKTDCVMLYQNPKDDDEWLRMPSRDDITAGTVAPVTFENGTQHEIHGKLFEKIVEANTTIFDDIGIATVPIEVTFDGIPVAMPNPNTGNNTTVMEPFGDAGNGTFQFLLDINKPAGEYELTVTFRGWPTTGQKIYQELTYKAVAYVNHPTAIDFTAAPSAVKVGDPIQINGELSDDTGRPITSVGLQVRFDNVLP